MYYVSPFEIVIVNPSILFYLNKIEKKAKLKNTERILKSTRQTH
jgi:hypothetical protein